MVSWSGSVCGDWRCSKSLSGVDVRFSIRTYIKNTMTKKTTMKNRTKNTAVPAPPDSPTLGIATAPDPNPTIPFVIGGQYFIRAVTHHYTGRVVRVYPNWLVLQQAAWIPSDGRFADALLSCNFEEVEPYPPDNDVIIGLGAILDATLISKLPLTQK